LIGNYACDLSQVNLGVGGGAAQKQGRKETDEQASDCKSGWRPRKWSGHGAKWKGKPERWHINSSEDGLGLKVSRLKPSSPCYGAAAVPRHEKPIGL
jgi:hypothetical protein